MNDREVLREVKEGKLRPIYLVYGEEPFLKEQVLKAIESAAFDPVMKDSNYEVVHPSNDQLERALSLAYTHTFVDRRVVVVKDSPLFVAARKKGDGDGGEEEKEKGSAGDEPLLKYLANPMPTTCLVFLNGDTVDSRKKTTKALIATGGVVECRSMKGQDATMWAQRRAYDLYLKQMDDAAALLLVEKLGVDLQLVDSELGKLSLYVGDAPHITAKDIEQTVSGVAETEIFRLTEAVMLKDRPKALALLAQTLRQVDHPLQVLAALTNRFRQILTVKALLDRGTSMREGPGLAKMHPYAYEKMVGHVRSFPRDVIVQAMRRLLEADLAMKSGQDPKLTLETVTVELMA